MGLVRAICVWYTIAKKKSPTSKRTIHIYICIAKNYTISACKYINKLIHPVATAAVHIPSTKEQLQIIYPKHQKISKTSQVAVAYTSSPSNAINTCTEEHKYKLNICTSTVARRPPLPYVRTTTTTTSNRSRLTFQFDWQNDLCEL